jgi:hypothetical protein
MTNMIIAALRGVPAGKLDPEPANQEQIVAFLLQQVWFSALVGWMGGLIAKSSVIDQLRIALTLLLRGMEKQE